MSAIKELQEKWDATKVIPSDLEMSVLYCSDPQKYDLSYINTDVSASELAALTARVAELEAVKTAAKSLMRLHKKYSGIKWDVRGDVTVADYNDALDELAAALQVQPK